MILIGHQGGDDSGENATLLTTPTASEKGVFAANRIAYTAPSMSVTAFAASLDCPVCVALNDFETVAPNNASRYGASVAIVANPLVSTTSPTARVARIGRTSSNWFELFAFNNTPVVIPANSTYYLHTMVSIMQRLMLVSELMVQIEL